MAIELKWDSIVLCYILSRVLVYYGFHQSHALLSTQCSLFPQGVLTSKVLNAGYKTAENSMMMNNITIFGISQHPNHFQVNGKDVPFTFNDQNKVRELLMSGLLVCLANDLHLTLKHRETHGCVVSTVATDALVLKHQTISIHNAD